MAGATTTTWPELVSQARGYQAGGDGRTNTEYAQTLAAGIIGMDAELHAIMAPHMLRAVRLYTDELGALRKRAAKLEQAIIEFAQAGHITAKQATEAIRDPAQTDGG